MMKKLTKYLSSILTAAVLLASQTVFGQTAFSQEYEITVTNITMNLILTPVLAASHVEGVKMFTLGQPALVELQQVAEAGNLDPLVNAINAATGIVIDHAVSDGPIPPGGSITLRVIANGAPYVTVVSMLVPTNDTFFAVNGQRVPEEGVLRVLSPGYDSGSETNDESCDHIPGPPAVCQGEGFSPDDDGEGFVHISRGISGNGDISVSDYDWRNPVAEIVVRRVPASN